METKELYILLDTSFLINLVSPASLYHDAALSYFNEFKNRKYQMAVSTIAISEFAIKDDVTNLPLNMLNIIAFNYGHAVKAGLFGAHTSLCRKQESGTNRAIVLSDSKMMAQAELEKIDYIVSADHKAIRPYQWLKDAGMAHFAYLDITATTITDFFNELPLTFE